MNKHQTIKYLHIDVKAGPAVKKCFLNIKTDDEEVKIDLSEKDISVLSNFILSHCYTQIEPEGKIGLTFFMIGKILRLWTPSFIRKKY